MLAIALYGYYTHGRSKRAEGELEASRAHSFSSISLPDTRKVSSRASGLRAVSIRSMIDCSTNFSRRSYVCY